MLCKHMKADGVTPCNTTAMQLMVTVTRGKIPMCDYHAGQYPAMDFEEISPKVRPGFPEIYMRLAHDLARRSTCSRLQVGCVITSPDFREVYALGYNGGPVGGFNNCKSMEPGKCGHIHAEDNACNYAPARVEKVAFVNYAPCEMCAIRMVNKLGFTKVYYGQAYRSNSGLMVLADAGIEVEHLEVSPWENF